MSTPQAKQGSALVPFGVVIAAGLVISVSIAVKTFERVKLGYGTITVKGYAEKRITSDMAAWWGNFSARSANLVDAYDKLEKDLGIVLSYLEKHGVKREDMNVSSISTAVLYVKDEKGEDTNQIEGYVLGQSVDLTSPDVALVTTIAGDSTSLIKEGVEFRSGEPQYFYSKLEDLKLEMLAAATKDAHARAAEIASNSGVKVGPPRSAQQGVFQITTPYSTDVSGYGRYDTSTIDKSIKAIVAVEYSIR